MTKHPICTVASGRQKDGLSVGLHKQFLPRPQSNCSWPSLAGRPLASILEIHKQTIRTQVTQPRLSNAKIEKYVQKTENYFFFHSKHDYSLNVYEGVQKQAICITEGDNFNLLKEGAMQVLRLELSVQNETYFMSNVSASLNQKLSLHLDCMTIKLIQ